MTNLLGVSFSPLTMNDTIELLDHHIDSKTNLFQVVTANPEMVMNAQKNQDFMNLMEEVDLITPDGIGVVIGSKIIKNPLPERVAGYDMVHALFEKRNQLGKKTTVYAVGAKDEVIKLAMRKLRQLYSELEIIGYHHGYFESGSEDEQAIIEDISNKNPDVLLVGLGSPRQEFFIHTNKEVLGAKLAIGCGGTFDVLAGVVKRAPVVFQKVGLEWFYRLLQQPSRIKRQMILPKFIIQVFKSKKIV